MAHSSIFNLASNQDIDSKANPYIIMQSDYADAEMKDFPIIP